MRNRILIGDIDDCLSAIEDSTIDCAVTSPPYWSQRDYEFKGQIGQEKTLEDYCLRLVKAFRMLKKKLTEKGIFFLNIGDKYLSKYGNTPLGMIPFVLAYYLELDGWYLDDILAWYKPNHMPSSIKNRFTNTYEPVFVLARNEANYHSDYRRKKQQEETYTSILKVKLQPTPHKHMAVYPEKLVEALIKRGIPPGGVVCDPFGGSGTTGRAVRNMNQYSLKTLEQVNRWFIIIEGNGEYLDIILERTGLKKEDVTLISSVSGQDFTFTNPVIPLTSRYSPQVSRDYFFTKSSICTVKDEREKKLFFQSMLSEETFHTFPDPGILYAGFVDLSLEDYYHLSQLKDHGWIIRNMLVCTAGKNTWFPFFFIVKDQKRVKYRFNLDRIRIAHKSNWGTDWKEVNFTGFEVVDKFTRKDKQRKGIISAVKKRYQDGMPEKVAVEWEDGEVTAEHVIHEEEWWHLLTVTCPLCKTDVVDKEEFFYQLNCQSCGKKLWKDMKTLPVIEEKYLSVEGERDITIDPDTVKRSNKQVKKEYSGKFVDASKINKGQSPAARAATQEMFFSTVRRYGIQQDLVADLLNIYRKEARLSKKAVTDRFPPEYIHTVGHWLRKDMGGSIPLPEDLKILASIIELSKELADILSKWSLKLQTVKKAAKGKNPGDYLEGDEEMVTSLLKRSMK